MDTLQTMKVFVRVAQGQGFAAAARDLHMSRAAVTKHVSALESRIGARLLSRTTRKVSLTEAGRVYLERCLEALQSVDDADASVSELVTEPTGLLRITCPLDMQEYLGPVIGLFMHENPRVVVDLQASNRPIDLVDEGFDLAVRIAPGLDGRYIARPLALMHMGIFGAPSYFRAHGRPKRPADLPRHHALAFAEPKPRVDWTLERGGRKVTITLRPAMLSNSGRALQAAAVAGAGLYVGPSFSVTADLEAKKLERALPEWKVLPDLRIYAVYPHRRFLAAKVRAFVEALRGAFGEEKTADW